jgi:hypothetical protein
MNYEVDSMTTHQAAQFFLFIAAWRTARACDIQDGKYIEERDEKTLNKRRQTNG